MVQEILQGDDSNIIVYLAYYDLEGHPPAEFSARKIRHDPPSFGNARVAESIDNPEIISLNRTLLKELDYRGSLVSNEFKYDDRNGKLKFIEINPRSCMFQTLVEASGVNLPWIMYQELVLGKKVARSPQKNGIFWIHEATDVSRFRRNQERIPFREYISPYFSKKVFAVFALDDLKPSIMEWLSTCGAIIKLGAGLIRKLR
jgi:D-aspartate ligase